MIWRVKKHKHNGKKPYIVFTYTTSPDGDQGSFFILKNFICISSFFYYICINVKIEKVFMLFNRET